MEKNVVELWLQADIGSNGAATLKRGKGITSITRDGSTAGKYSIVLDDTYYGLLDVDVKFIVATGTPAAPIYYVISEDVASTKTIVIQCLDGDTPAATDPASGEKMRVHITLYNSGAL